MLAHIQAISGIGQVKRLSKEEADAKALITTVGPQLDELYLKAVTSVSLHPEVVKAISDDFHIVYTPLHGAGNTSVRQALAAIGFDHVHVVPEQEEPDPNFSSVRSPNPE